MGAAVDQFYPVGAGEPVERTTVPVDADRMQRRRLALHQCPATKGRLHREIMRRPEPQQHLTQPAQDPK